MSTKKIVAVLIAAGVVSAYFLFTKGESAPEPLSEQVTTTDVERADGESPKQAVVITSAPEIGLRKVEPQEPSDYVLEMIDRIKQEFGDRIHLVAVQVQLKEFRDDLIRGYPAHGEKMFEGIIRGAFPELADQILAAVMKMVAYETWLLASMLDLNDMDLLAQQNTLWGKRLEFFGEDAKEIWSEEMSAEEEHHESVRKVVAMLDTAYDMSMDERLYLIQSAFDESYSQSMSDLVLDSSGVMTRVFFGFESVQKDLKAMQPEQRQEAVDDIRRKVGFAEETIEFMSAQDQKKEARWQNGYAYMKERDAVPQNDLSDEEYNVALQDVREKYFGREAYTIASEEDDLGFFRFERRRQYGNN